MVEYTIYADDNLIYSSATPEFGAIISPKLKLEVNKSGSLSFTILPDHEYYDFIFPMKTLVYVYEDEGTQFERILFRGRVIEAKTDFFKQKQITCEGDLSFLLDSVISPFSYGNSDKKTIKEIFKHIVDEHNAQMDSLDDSDHSNFKKFSYDLDNYVTVVTGTNDGKDIFDCTSYSSASDTFTNELLSIYGGILRSRTVNEGGTLVTYLDYIKDPSQVNGPHKGYYSVNDQEIEFGVNLLDMEASYPISDIFTILLPVGGDKVTIEEVNGGSKFLENQAAIDVYGRIVKVQQWSDIKDKTKLKQKAQKYLNEQTKIYSDDLTVKAIDLHYLNSSTSRLSLCDKVAIYSEPHDIGVDEDMVLICLSIEYDLQNPENNSYKLGNFIPASKEKKQTKKSKGGGGGGGGGKRGGGGGTPDLSGLTGENEDDNEENAEDVDTLSTLTDTLSYLIGGEKVIDQFGIAFDPDDPVQEKAAIRRAQQMTGFGNNDNNITSGVEAAMNTLFREHTEDETPEDKDPDGITGDSGLSKITEYSGWKDFSKLTDDSIKHNNQIYDINAKEIVIGDIDTDIVKISGKKIVLNGLIENFIVQKLNAEEIEAIRLTDSGVIVSNDIKTTTFSSASADINSLTVDLNEGTALVPTIGSTSVSNNCAISFGALKWYCDEYKRYATQTWVTDLLTDKSISGEFNSLKLEIGGYSGNNKIVATRGWTLDKLSDKSVDADFRTLKVNGSDVATASSVHTYSNVYYNNSFQSSINLKTADVVDVNGNTRHFYYRD